MAAKESKEMKRARLLVTTRGYTAYAAAKEAGISKQAIYMSKWYKDWRNANK